MVLKIIFINTALVTMTTQFILRMVPIDLNFVRVVIVNTLQIRWTVSLLTNILQLIRQWLTLRNMSRWTLPTPIIIPLFDLTLGILIVITLLHKVDSILGTLNAPATSLLVHSVVYIGITWIFVPENTVLSMVGKAKVREKCTRLGWKHGVCDSRNEMVEGPLFLLFLC